MSQRSNLFQMKDRTCQYYSPSFLSHLHKHTQAYTFIPMSLVPFSHLPVASSLSSEPLPLRSDRGQHFSILQHAVCTLRDTPQTHLHQDVKVPAYLTWGIHNVIFGLPGWPCSAIENYITTCLHLNNNRMKAKLPCKMTTSSLIHN